jgi:hypothetical protein
MIIVRKNKLRAKAESALIPYMVSNKYNRGALSWRNHTASRGDLELVKLMARNNLRAITADLGMEIATGGG